MKKSKYVQAFHELSKEAVFTSAQGRLAGIPSRMLAHFCEKGEIERISRGVFRVPQTNIDPDFEWEDFILTILSIPKGIMCLISALYWPMKS